MLVLARLNQCTNRLTPVRQADFLRSAKVLGDLADHVIDYNQFIIKKHCF